MTPREEGIKIIKNWARTYALCQGAVYHTDSWNNFGVMPCAAPFYSPYKILHNPTFIAHSIKVTSPGVPFDEKQSLLYLDFIFNPNLSPWRSLLPYIEVIKNKDLPIGVLVSDLDKTPADLLVNFLIALRYTNEFPYQVRAFEFFIKDFGLDPRFAFVLQYFYAVKEKPTPVLMPALFGKAHTCFKSDEVCISDLMNGKPNHGEFKYNPDYKKGNQIRNIWGRIEETITLNYSQSIDKVKDQALKIQSKYI